MMPVMRSTGALAFVLAACATGSAPGGGDDDDIDARPRPDADDSVPIDAEDAPDSMPTGGGEMTAQEFLCNDSFDNDNDGQTDCTDTSCAWACTVMGGACTAPNKLRAYAMAPMPQSIVDAGSVNASVTIAQTGTITLTAVRFNAAHTYDQDIDLTVRSAINTQLDITSDNGSTGDNYVNTVFIDSAGTTVVSGTAPFTGSFQPEQLLGAWNGQSITGTWASTLTDDDPLIAGTWQELSLGFCVSP